MVKETKKNRLAKYVLIQYTGINRYVYGFTGSFRPVLVKLKRDVRLFPGWYMVLKHPTHHTIIVNDYSEIKPIDGIELYDLLKRLRLRYSSLTSRYKGRIDDFVRVTEFRRVWDYAVYDNMYLLILGTSSMLFTPFIRQLLVELPGYSRYGLEKCIVSNNSALKTSLIVVDAKKMRDIFDVFEYARFSRFVFGSRTAILTTLMALNFALGYGDEEDVLDTYTYKRIIKP